MLLKMTGFNNLTRGNVTDYMTGYKFPNRNYDWLNESTDKL